MDESIIGSLCGQRIQHYCYHKAYGYLRFLPGGQVIFTSDVLRATTFRRSSFALNHFTQEEWRSGPELLLVEDIEVQRIRVSWEQAPLTQKEPGGT